MLAPLGLVEVTTDQRNALEDEPDGSLIYQTDDERIEVLVNGGWEPVALTPGVEALFDVLYSELARHRQALQFLEVDPSMFDPLDTDSLIG